PRFVRGLVRHFLHEALAPATWLRNRCEVTHSLQRRGRRCGTESAAGHPRFEQILVRAQGGNSFGSETRSCTSAASHMERFALMPAETNITTWNSSRKISPPWRRIGLIQSVCTTRRLVRCSILPTGVAYG